MNSNVETVLEIGFNAGFSTLLMLMCNKKVRVTCIDICEHAYTYPCYRNIQSVFGDRLELIVGDSRSTLKDMVRRSAPRVFDLIHIDGGHTPAVAEEDISNSHALSRRGTVIVMDDCDMPQIRNVWDKCVEKYSLADVDYLLETTDLHQIKIV